MVSPELARELLATIEIDRADQVRQYWATRALVKSGRRGPQIANAVKRLYKTNRHAQIRAELGQIIGELGGGAADMIPELIANMKSDPYAKGTLTAIGKPAVAPLLKMVNSADKRTCWTIYEILGGLGRDAAAAIPLLIRELESPRDPWFGELAARTLGQIGVFNDDVVKALKTASESDTRAGKQARKVLAESANRERTIRIGDPTR
jgi:HEAT repeat protein